MNLIDHLKTVRDYRTQPDYELWVVLLLVLIGTMSGCTGYRALATFVQRHQQELIAVLQLPYDRLPSFSTIRRLMVRVDFTSLTQAFNAWAQATFTPSESEQIATDGKGIKASLKDYDQAYQDFVSVVSAFSVRQGVVVGLEPMRNGEGSEIQTVEMLLDKLHLKRVCFSLDALHAQKKTLQRIIEQENDYLVTVKGNQKTLFQQLQQSFAQTPPDSIAIESDTSHGRQIQRTVSVLESVSDISPQWVGVQRLIRVERVGTRSGKPFSETMFYISSLTLDAQDFAQSIRQHWHIENRLHWVKDAVLKEDSAPLCDGHAPTNFAIIRTMALNLFRSHGFDSITQGIRQVAHDIGRLFSFLQ